ncbi:hypothetical protein [Nocardioides cynanchi]|uniref:hypothetical protein n=1 Tax=Nocardioides cynanchi TaxID=2558918 RepID=UPI00124509C6|nr:hypothetical protein [Nocardioides cynanchi]
MSIDDLARTAAADLRAHTHADLDAGLDALLVVHPRRRRLRAATAIAVAAAAVVAVAWWASAGLPGRHSSPEPTHVPTGPVDPACAAARVLCHGDRTYTFGLHRPVTWQIPQGYGVNSGAGASTSMVESYAVHRPAGVTVMEGVRAASRTSRAATRVPPTPSGFIHWLAERPYLRASAVRRTTLDGRPAWQVRVAVRSHHTNGPGRCDGFPCHPITFQRGAVTGVWADMTADYTAFRVRGAGTVVVWSWAFAHDTTALAHNHRVVDGLSWPDG